MASQTESENRREHFRTYIKLNAELRQNDRKFKVIIVDISPGGLKIESDQIVSVDEYFTLKFELHSSRIVLHCKAVRAILGGATKNLYGCRYEYVKESDLKKICSFAFDAQALARWYVGAARQERA